MTKKIISVIAALAITSLTVVPAFASASSDIDAAQVAQDARNRSIAAGQENIANFQEAEKEKGNSARSQGQAAVNSAQEALASFKSGEIAKGEAATEAGKSALETAQNALNSFWASQKETEASDQAERSSLQDKINKYLSSL